MIGHVLKFKREVQYVTNWLYHSINMEGLHFIASLLSVIASLNMKFAPIIEMVFSDDEIASLDTSLFPITKSLAIMHNTGLQFLVLLY
jgi:hypothetical protein